MTHAESALQHPMALFTAVAIAGALVIGSVIYSQVLLTSIYDREGDLRRVSADVQREVALVHLWLEEALTEHDTTHDAPIDFLKTVEESVRSPLTAVRESIKEQRLRLNENSPIFDSTIRSSLTLLEEQVTTFARIVEERISDPTSGATGSDLDQQLDQTFFELLATGKSISTQLQGTIAKRRDFIGVVHLIIVLFIAVLLFVGLYKLVWHRLPVGGKDLLPVIKIALVSGKG